MPSAAIRTRRSSAYDLAAQGITARMIGVAMRNPKNCVVAAIAAGIVTMVLVNALFLQNGPHPAPLMAFRPPPVIESPIGAVARSDPQPPAMPARPEVVPSRAQSDLISNIQRELARRGFYDGAVDGIHGAKTDAAIRDFESAFGRKPSAELTASLLHDIQKFPLRPAAQTRVAPERADPIAALIGPSRQVLAVQRALNDYGYGPIKPSGLVDKETRAAVTKFERERRLPVTGEISQRVIRELSSRTGRPLE